MHGLALADMNRLVLLDVSHDNHLSEIVVVLPVPSIEEDVEAWECTIRIGLQLIVAQHTLHLIAPTAPVRLIQFGELQGSGVTFRIGLTIVCLLRTYVSLLSFVSG
jgi:hypothetical protein